MVARGRLTPDRTVMPVPDFALPMRRQDADRRGRPRFEIVGDVTGTLETAVSLLLRDVGRGGVLVESSVILTAGALHTAMFSCDGQQTSVGVCVRHVRPVVSGGGQRFLAGLEFTTVTPGLLELIERWMGLQGGALSPE